MSSSRRGSGGGSGRDRNDASPFWKLSSSWRLLAARLVFFSPVPSASSKKKSNSGTGNGSKRNQNSNNSKKVRYNRVDFSSRPSIMDNFDNALLVDLIIDPEYVTRGPAKKDDENNIVNLMLYAFENDEF